MEATIQGQEGEGKGEEEGWCPPAAFLAAARATGGRSGTGEEEGRQKKGWRRERMGFRHVALKGTTRGTRISYNKGCDDRSCTSVTLLGVDPRPWPLGPQP
jgi:hypothetical protein